MSWFEQTGSEHAVAIVTGASRGLGFAVARELLQAGLRVIVDARDPAALASARDDLARLGEVVAIPGDVADSDHAHALVAAADAFGRLDLLVNNASTLGEVPLPRVDQLSRATFDRLFAVNTFAPVHLMQHALRLMLRAPSTGSGQGPATIVNVTSDAAHEAYPRWGGYGASKAALEHLSRVLAAELDGSAVRVMLFDPGDMDTQMHRDAVPDADPTTLRDPADAARALLRVVSEMVPA